MWLCGYVAIKYIYIYIFWYCYYLLVYLYRIFDKDNRSGSNTVEASCTPPPHVFRFPPPRRRTHYWSFAVRGAAYSMETMVVYRLLVSLTPPPPLFRPTAASLPAFVFPQTVLALRGSYLSCIVIPLGSRIAGCQPRYLSPKVPKPSCQ